MKVLVTGASGLVGTALCEALRQRGDEVVRVQRQRGATPGGTSVLEWDMQTPLPTQSLEGVQGVVHLAGVNLADTRWTAAFKQAICDSRLVSTRFLAEGLARMTNPPKVLVSTSAIGLYGDAGDRLLDEQAPAGRGFLAELAQNWESAATPAREAGIRVVHPRLGVVLAAHGGALAKMLPPFRAGLGGPLGTGSQYLSWIALEDVVRILLWMLDTPTAVGAYNLVAPQALPQGEFARTLGQVLHRPAVLPAPALALRMLLGEMADAMLLASTRVEPRRLLEAGFVFKHPELRSALEALLTAS